MESKAAKVTAPVGTVTVASPVTKSSKIKELYDSGTPIGEIAKTLGIRYAFAYQVASRHAAATGKPFATGRTAGPTKSSKIRELFDTGKTVGQIAKELNLNYTFCWMTVSAYKKQLAKKAQAQG
jgi:hypothetical protein